MSVALDARSAQRALGRSVQNSARIERLAEKLADTIENAKENRVRIAALEAAVANLQQRVTALEGP